MKSLFSDMLRDYVSYPVDIGIRRILSSFIPTNVQPWDATGLNISTRVTERKEDRGDLTGGSADTQASKRDEETIE